MIRSPPIEFPNKKTIILHYGPDTNLFFLIRTLTLIATALVFCICRIFRKLGKVVLLLSAVLALGIAPVSVQGTSIPPAVISISVVDALISPLVSVPIFSWTTGVGRPLEFGAAVSRVDSSPVDVYFGIIIPGGRIFSWISGTANVPILLEGLFPAAQRITDTDTAISSAELLGRNPQHIFSADHPLGLYLVFFFLVPTGTDPGDSRHWIAATMSPLMIFN